MAGVETNESEGGVGHEVMKTPSTLVLYIIVAQAMCFGGI